ncbi:MAG: amidohydrolase family protein, partial [Gammaproteobacteria bacterium]
LRAATAYGGEAWAGASGELLGRVKAGYLADLIVVDGDPFADIRVLQDRNRITAVMKDGSFCRRPPPGACFASARPRRRRAAA